MANRIILVTGGARSGKSRYCQLRAELISGKKVYVATCPADQQEDPEMRLRIDRHKDDRSGRGWQTVEEPLALGQALKDSGQAAVIMVDCLTLWISNLMFAHTKANKIPLSEDEVETLCNKILQVARNCAGTVLFVSNEVGLGVVPDNALARQYRDLVGRCNQVIAADAHEVVLVHCGISMKIK